MFEQERVLVRLRQHVLRESSIINCFLAGSFGRNQADPYADLDLVLVFRDETVRQMAFASRRDFARTALPYVPSKSCDAEHIHPYLHIAVYGNGAKVDYLYETQETLPPGAFGSDLNLLKDKDGWGEEYVAASSTITKASAAKTMTAGELAALDDRFWVMFVEVFRQLLRGDQERSFPVYLELVYRTLSPMLRHLPLDDEARRGLREVRFDDDWAATVGQLHSLLHAYRAARQALVRRHQLDFTIEHGFESSIIALVNRLTDEAQ